MVTITTTGNFIDDVKHAIEHERITPEEGAAEIAFRLNASHPESLKRGWPLVTSIERAIEVLAPAQIDEAEVLKRFRYDDAKDDDAVMVVERGPLMRDYYPWPDAPVINVGMPTQSRVYGSINWSALGDVHPDRASQFAKALRLAAYEISLAGPHFDI